MSLEKNYTPFKKINPIVDQRYSARIFDSKSISESDLSTILLSASSAPSSYNRQPWKYMYVPQGQYYFNAVISSLTDKNKEWAKNAPAFILAIADRSEAYKHLEYDLGQSVAYLTFQAVELNINVRQIAGFNSIELTSALELDDSLEVFTVIAIGYKFSLSELEELANRERKWNLRKPLNKILLSQ
jgi:nitroreductase